MSDYTDDLGLPAEEATVIDRDFAAMEDRLAAAEKRTREAEKTLRELRSSTVNQMQRYAYLEARQRAVNDILFDIEEDRRNGEDDDLSEQMVGKLNLVKVLRRAQADVFNRWRREFGEEVTW